MDDDLARPGSGEQRLDRGTEWFGFRDGLINEVRAYHHGGRKNPQGDLLGFDHAGPRLHHARGLAGAELSDDVIRTAAPGLSLPPFGEEHEELRETVRRFVTDEIAPNVSEWEEAREFPRELFQRCGELGFLGLKFPEEYGGQGGTHLHDAVWVEELARSGASGGVGAGLNAHASIAMPPVFNFGTEEQRRRWIVPGIRARRSGRWGSPSRAPAPTSPASAPSPAASTAATSSTAPRPSSPTGSAPTSSSAPARRPRRAATAASPSWYWSARCRATR